MRKQTKYKTGLIKKINRDDKGNKIFIDNTITHIKCDDCKELIEKQFINDCGNMLVCDQCVMDSNGDHVVLNPNF